MKTAISLPDPLFDAADRIAKRLHMSRSQLYAQALEAFVRVHQDDAVTEALNAVYAKHPAVLDPAMKRAQTRHLRRETW